MRRLSQIAGIVPVIVAGTLAWATSASAASAPPVAVSVQQSSGVTGNYFKVNGRPGQTSRAGSLKLKNQTGKSITVVLDPVSGLTASTLGSAYGLRGSKASGSATWIVLGQRRVTLGPRAGTRVPVSVSVPSDAGPGDYLAGVGVQSQGPGKVQTEGNVAIASIERYAVGIETMLPGPRNPQIKLTGVGLNREPAGVTFTIKGRNAGNVILKNVKGSATVSEDSDVVARRTLGPGTFVTDTSIAYPLLVSSLQPSQGTAFRVQAELRYRGGVARIDKVVQFGAIDAKRQQQYGGPQASSGGDDKKKLLLGLLLLLLIGGSLAWLQARRRRKGSGEGALLRTLPREIIRARTTDEPLCVILVAVDGGRTGSLAGAVRASLRPRDQLFSTKNSGLIVISPDTNPDAGEVLAADIRRNVARSGNGAATVVPVTSAAQSSAEELLEAAAAISADQAEGGNGEGGNGDAGNGAGHERRVERGSQSEVRHSGTEAPAVGGDGGTRRRP
jgi:hypothetical protein